MSKSSALLAAIAAQMDSERVNPEGFRYGVKHTRYASYVYKKRTAFSLDEKMQLSPHKDRGNLGASNRSSR